MRTAHRIGSVLISLICATACNLPDDVLEPDRAQAGAAGADAEGDPGGSTGGTGAVDPGANGGGEDGEDGEDDDAKGGKAATGGKGNSAPEPGDDEEPAEPGPGPANPGAVLEEASRGSAVALSSDESLGVIVNRDVGSISVLKLDTSSAGRPAIVSTTEVDLGKSSEPWQVVIAPDGDTAFVVLRREQKIVRVRYLSSEPRVDGSCNVGSEPTSIALTPTGNYAYVTNWNDGNLSVFDTSTLEKLPDIDLNPALVATGYLGEVAPRAALAHPRSIIISNDLDDSDEDESLYVTEYFGQQAEAGAADGSNADTRNVGILYKVALATGTVKTIRLSPLSDMGFKDANNQDAGCYPNQVQSIALNGPYAYVVSVCASPKGPLGGKVTTTNCTVVDDCAGLNLVDPACVTPFAGAPSAVCVDVAGFKTTTAPLLSIVDTRTDQEVEGSARNLNAEFNALYGELGTAAGAQRFPLFADDIAFVPETSVAYVTANGTDAVFRLVFDAGTGLLDSVGSSTNPFIDLTPAGIKADQAGKNPIGIAIGSNARKFALVANDVSRNLSVLDFNQQAVAGGIESAEVVATAALPEPGSADDQVLRGKRFFNTGSGRWSLRGQGWGACQSCHSDGLTDNVTWHFARGPRQSTGLDGSFASKNPSDQRIFNWTAIFDEVADFEGNVRDVSGGVGATVSAVSVPPQTSDRINFAGIGHAGLNGSSAQAADKSNPLDLDPAPQLNDWSEVEKYMQSIRSPRAPSNLDPYQVAEGEKLFLGASCQGCHSGDKWTISQRFYTPGSEKNASLNTTAFEIPYGFPQALLPAQLAANQTLRFNGGNAAALDQILCAIRPVGTFNVAEPGVGVAELRADMTTLAQGDGNPAGEGRGYNPPSLLNIAAGAPYLHAGNARTLEALFGSTFQQHHRALSPNFLTETDPNKVSAQIVQLTQYLLSIDEDSQPIAIPEPGAAGGLLCPTSF
jgi:hypothetical protein